MIPQEGARLGKANPLAFHHLRRRSCFAAAAPPFPEVSQSDSGRGERRRGNGVTPLPWQWSQGPKLTDCFRRRQGRRKKYWAGSSARQNPSILSGVRAFFSPLALLLVQESTSGPSVSLLLRRPSPSRIPLATTSCPLGFHP